MLDFDASDLKQCGTLNSSAFLDQPENEEYTLYTHIYIYGTGPWARPHPPTQWSWCPPLRVYMVYSSSRNSTSNNYSCSTT